MSWICRPSIRILAAAVAAGAAPAWAAELPADGAGGRGGAVELPPVAVVGAGYRTESTNSYRSDLISVGEKDARPAREVPQSTTVLTRRYLDDRNATSLDTALRTTPGMVVLTNDNGRSSLLSRGFEFDTLYFNGLPAPLSSIYGTQPDMAIIDHVEILKGPAGLFGGAGEPAGAINMHLKEPSKELHGAASLSGGSWGTGRAEGDISTPLNASGTIRGRFVGAYERQDGWVKGVGNDVGVGYGTVQADLTDSTTATVTFSHMERDIEPYNGLPSLANGKLLDLDRSTTTGADWNDFSNRVDDYIGEIEHLFDGGGHAKLGIRYSDRSVDFLYGYAANAANAAGVVNGMRWLARQYDETSLALDGHVSKPFTLFGQEHNILVGADYRRIDNDLKNATGVISGLFSLNNWNTAVAKPRVAYSSDTGTTLDQYGAYGQLRIKPIDRVTLIGGGRGTWYQSDTVNKLTGAATASQDVDGQATPYAGIIVDLLPHLSAYASRTETFQPQTEVDAAGRALQPRQGDQYEGGLKADFLGGALAASVAYFDLHDKNRALADIVTGKYSALGEVASHGFEAEASGNILPNWEIMAGYTYTLTDYVNGVSAGSAFSSVTPKHQFQLWTKYRLATGSVWADKLFVGGGIRTFSDISALSSGATIQAPGYTVVDLQAGYDLTANVTAVLTVNNALDETYYSRVGGTSVFNFYGEPRSALMTLKASF